MRWDLLDKLLDKNVIKIMKSIKEPILLTILAQDYYNETGESLTKTTDQTVEAAHQWLDKLLRRSNYWVKDALSARHGELLLKGDV